MIGHSFQYIMQAEEQTLPERNNFYATFKGVSKNKIKEVFEANGWHLHKSSWTDFGLTNEWSELTLEGEEHEPLLNGMMVYHNINIEKLDKILHALTGQSTYEFYDKDRNLLLEKKTVS